MAQPKKRASQKADGPRHKQVVPKDHPYKRLRLGLGLIRAPKSTRIRSYAALTVSFLRHRKFRIGEDRDANTREIRNILLKADRRPRPVPVKTLEPGHPPLLAIEAHAPSMRLTSHPTPKKDTMTESKDDRPRPAPPAATHKGEAHAASTAPRTDSPRRPSAFERFRTEDYRPFKTATERDLRNTRSAVSDLATEHETETARMREQIENLLLEIGRAGRHVDGMNDHKASGIKGSLNELHGRVKRLEESLSAGYDRKERLKGNMLVGSSAAADFEELKQALIKDLNEALEDYKEVPGQIRKLEDENLARKREIEALQGENEVRKGEISDVRGIAVAAKGDVARHETRISRIETVREGKFRSWIIVVGAVLGIFVGIIAATIVASQDFVASTTTDVTVGGASGTVKTNVLMAVAQAIAPWVAFFIPFLAITGIAVILTALLGSKDKEEYEETEEVDETESHDTHTGRLGRFGHRRTPARQTAHEHDRQDRSGPHEDSDSPFWRTVNGAGNDHPRDTDGYQTAPVHDDGRTHPVRT